VLGAHSRQIWRVTHTDRSLRALCAAALLLNATACEPRSAPLVWDDEVPASPAEIAALWPHTASSRPALAADTLHPEPADSLRCTGSWRAKRTPRGVVAVWWSIVPGDPNRVHLLSAWRDSLSAAGDTVWRTPVMVDSLDRGARNAQEVAEGAVQGCNRPAPGFAVDSVNGYVHVAYAMTAPEGAGVFYAHQMDPRAAFEPPIPMVYGDYVGVAEVASDGEVVAVVYEDPNSGLRVQSRGDTRTRIGLAMSRASGHVFERRLTVDGGQHSAMMPRVRVHGNTVTVAWQDVSPPRAGGVQDTAWRMRRGEVR
jgi:hypothetical protein